MDLLTSQILEIRYKPIPKLLDYRGALVEAIANHMELPQWKIIENRIDIYDDDNTKHAFVSYRNAGFVVNDADTKNYFSDQAVKLFLYLHRLPGFEEKPFVERIGIRTRFCKPYGGTFESLLENYSKKYMGVTDQAAKILNGKLADIGGSVNYSSGQGNYNIGSGPMKSEQIRNFVDTEKEIPEVGLFFDIDYWIMPRKELGSEDIPQNI